MAKSNKVIDKKFIKDFTKERLWQLTKVDFRYLLNKHSIEFKKSASKDELMQLLLDNKIDMWEVYEYGKCECFGMYAYDLEKLLDIDSKLRAKLQKKDILKVAYTQKSSWGGNSVVNFYDLECLYNMSKTQWEEYKSEYAIKELSNKQKMALLKREEIIKKRKEEEEEQLIKDTTCKNCGRVTMNLDWVTLVNGNIYCNDCMKLNEDIIVYNNAINDFFKVIYKNKDNYLIFDAETTNLYFDDICSISIIDFNRNIILDEIVKPNGIIEPEATYSHQITNDIAKNGISSLDLAIKLRDIFKKNKKIIFYNIGKYTLAEYFEKANIDLKKLLSAPNDLYSSDVSILDLCEFISCESYFDTVNDNHNSNYSYALSNYQDFDRARAGIDCAAHQSLKDCFRMRDGIEHYAKHELRKLLF